MRYYWSFVTDPFSHLVSVTVRLMFKFDEHAVFRPESLYLALDEEFGDDVDWESIC